MSELEFLGAVHVELLRHRELRPGHPDHELFQTSTVEALVAGAFDGDTTLGEVLEHGDLGLGTLDGLDGELIVLDGEPWKANLDCTLIRPDRGSITPYAVVVPFTPGPPIALAGPLDGAGLEACLRDRTGTPQGPTAIRIDGRFDRVQVRSVPKQHHPYPPLAEAIAHQQTSELTDAVGTMVGFLFPDALDGIEMLGVHLHLVTDDRSRGGHVLGFTLREGTAKLDGAAELHVELPPAVTAPRHGAQLDQAAIRRLETS
jgi:acetolactate decarboxylase